MEYRPHQECKVRSMGEVTGLTDEDTYAINVFFSTMPGLTNYMVSYEIKKPFGDLEPCKESKTFDFTEDGHSKAIIKFIEYRDLIDKNKNK
ncbi:TPA: hypothetical protein IQM23_002215 [Listeria monocytogenes]|nr:hypothetical protein [Listeria monocytogenes]